MNKPSSQIINQFLANNYCLIVEPSQSFAATIQATLMEMGLAMERIFITRKFEEARKLIQAHRPKLLVTEYDLNPQGLGLALVEQQEQLIPENDRVSIVVTKNSTDSAVAEAAEGHVDAYILKPFSTDTFTKKLAETILKKVDPTEYVKTVKAGRQKMAAKEYEAALALFQKAKLFDAKPSLACYYSGLAYQALGSKGLAMIEFKDGRKFQPLHYKCLIGEFEAQMAEKKYPEAYDLVKVIKKHYPITSHRLGQIFIAAVFTQHFEDMHAYYDLFLRLDQRTKWLVDLTGLALYTAGKFSVQRKEMKQAMDFFDMAIVAKARDLEFTGMVIEELVKGGGVKEADSILVKALPSDIGTPLYNNLKFKVETYMLDANQVIEKGRKLVASGEASPDLYTHFVKFLMKNGKATLAESIASKAIAEHPTLREALLQILHG